MKENAEEKLEKCKGQINRERQEEGEESCWLEKQE